MSFANIVVGAYIEHNGTRCRFVRRQAQITEWRSTTTFEHYQFTDAEMQKAIRLGELKLVSRERDLGKENAKTSKLHGERRETKLDWEEAERKLLYVLAVQRHGLPRSDATTDDWHSAIEEVWVDGACNWKRLRGKRTDEQQPRPSLKSVRRWTASGGTNPTAKKLLSDHRHKGNYDDRISATVRDILAELIEIHWRKQPPINMDDFKTIVEGRIKEHNDELEEGENRLAIPGETAIRSSIDMLPPEDVLRDRHGEARAFLKYGSGEAQADPKAPLDRVELDATPADLFVVDPDTLLPIGRPTIVVAIDRCTRMVLGWFVTWEKPSILSLMQCLRNAMLSKDYVAEMNEKHGWDIKHQAETFGIPRTLVLDRGLENIGRHVAKLAVKAGINRVLLMKRKSPWLKGCVERVIKTMSEKLLHPTAGTSFHNALMLMGYNPAKDAVCTMADLDHGLHKYFVDIYPRLPRRTLNNARSIDLWRNLTRKWPVDSVEDVDDLDHLFGRTDYGAVRRSGISVHSMQYSSPELTGYFKTKVFENALKKAGGNVEFFTDPADIGQIHVRLPHMPKTISVRVSPKWQRYAAGLSLFHHRRIREYTLKTARDANDVDQLLLCKLELMDIMRGQAALKVGGIRAAQTAARFEGASRVARAGTDINTTVPGSDAHAKDAAGRKSKPVASNDTDPAPATRKRPSAKVIKLRVSEADQAECVGDDVEEAEVPAVSISEAEDLTAPTKRPRRGYRGSL